MRSLKCTCFVIFVAVCVTDLISLLFVCLWLIEMPVMSVCSLEDRRRRQHHPIHSCTFRQLSYQDKRIMGNERLFAVCYDNAVLFYICDMTTL